LLSVVPLYYLYVACGDYPLLVHIRTATRDTTAGSAAQHVRRSRMSEESERMKQAVEDLPGDLEFLHRILWVVAEPELRSAEMCGVKVQSCRRAWIDLVDCLHAPATLGPIPPCEGVQNSLADRAGKPALRYRCDKRSLVIPARHLPKVPRWIIRGHGIKTPPL
jgi:hypothetical protein